MINEKMMFRLYQRMQGVDKWDIHESESLPNNHSPEKDLLPIQNAIKSVKTNGPHALPQVSFCSLDGCRITSASGNHDLSLVVVGCETSEVNLISFQGNLSSKPSESSLQSFMASNNTDEEIQSAMTSTGDNITQDESHSNVHVIRLWGHSGPVYGATFVHPMSDLMLTCSEDSSIRCWNREGCVRVYSEGHTGPIWSIDVSSLGLHFATGSRDTTAQLWDVEIKNPLRIFAGHTQDVDCIEFHPNCKYLATGSSDKTIRMWSVTDAKSLRMFTGHRNSVNCVVFSPDGQYLASAGDDRRIKIWDLRTSNVLKEFKGHQDSIRSISFNSDGSLLSSVGNDQSLKIWSVDMTQDAPQSKDSFSEGSICSVPLASYSIRNNIISSQFVPPRNLLLCFGSKDIS